MRFFWWVKCVGLALLIPSFSLHSQSIGMEGKAKNSKVRLLSELQAISSDTREIKLGIEIQLKKGWHTYSKNPGSVGAPPKIGWNLPPEWSASDLYFPMPSLIQPPQSKNPIWGYENAVIFPVKIYRVAPFESPLPIRLKINYLVCEVQCIPEEANLLLILPLKTKEKFSPHQKTIEKAFQTLPPETEPPKPQSETSFVGALLFAFLGGLILNFMPCVFPILFLKATHLFKTEATSFIRRSFFYTSLGIVVSFIALGLFLFFLQNRGLKVGWGFQFQNKYFLISMMVICFVFALSLFDIFSLKLPPFLLKNIERLKGPFWEGVFATLLSTPCSAPFLGIALAFALAQPPLLLLLFFFVMGVGLAVPYLCLTLCPHLLHILPKPGSWMLTLRRLLGLSLLATSLWLFYVVQTPISSSVFSAETIEMRVQKGETLFVVVTAQWCLTCQWNEKTMIETSWFEALLKSKNVSLVIVDWTHPNDTINDFIQKYGRKAIPFSMLLNQENHLVLPELLTRNMVETAWKEFFKDDNSLY